MEPATRRCSGCTACCHWLERPDAPAGEPCPHLAAGNADARCGIYADRPDVCRRFWCLWRMMGDVFDAVRWEYSLAPWLVGAIFILKRASQVGLLKAGAPADADFAVISVHPCDVGRSVLHNRRAMAQVLEMRLLGFPCVLRDGDRLVLERPLGARNDAYATILDEGLAQCEAQELKPHGKEPDHG